MTIRRRGSHGIVALLTAFSVACSGRGCASTPAPATQSTSPTSSQPPAVSAKAGSYWDSTGEHDALQRAIDAINEGIPRESFDPASVVTKVGSDPGKLYEWVRGHTDLVPYRGALRGPVGVLLDRLGNSLDRSLLLAELLRLAGHTTRLARTSIDTRTAGDLLNQMRTRRQSGSAAPTAVALPPRLDAELESKVSEFGLNGAEARRILSTLDQSADAMLLQLGRRVESQAPFLSKLVPHDSARSGRDQSWSAALRDHWWVQVSSGGKWVDLDLALPANPGAAERIPTETFDYTAEGPLKTLPAKDVHVVEVRVVIERWSSDRLEKEMVLSHVLKPAETVGLPVWFENSMQSGAPKLNSLSQQDPIAALRTAVTDEQAWIPVLIVGDSKFSHATITTQGEVRRGSAATSPRPRSPMGGFDALGGGAPESGEGILTGEWLEFEIRSPGESPVIVRRDVFDLLPARSQGQPVTEPVITAANRLERGLALLGTVQMLPMVSWLSPEFAASELIEADRVNRKPYAEMRRAAEAADVDAFQKAITDLRPAADALLALALGRFVWSPVGGDTFISQPNILAFRNTYRIDSGGRLISRQGFDIIANQVDVLPESPTSAFQARLTQGVTDTNLEALLIRAAAGNAGEALGESQVHNDNWLVLRTPADIAQVTNLPEVQGRRIGEALSAGFVAVVPRAGAAESAWWRIHPATGETVGIGPDGWGQGLTDYVINKALTAVLSTFAVGFLGSSILCMFGSSTVSLSAGVTWNSNSLKDLGSCTCVGVGVGALAGALVLPFLKLSPGLAAGAALIGRKAALEMSLKGFQVTAGAVMTGIRMLRDTVCSMK